MRHLLVSSLVANLLLTGALLAYGCGEDGVRCDIEAADDGIADLWCDDDTIGYAIRESGTYLIRIELTGNGGYSSSVNTHLEEAFECNDEFCCSDHSCSWSTCP